MKYIILLIALTFVSCKENSTNMKAFTNVEDARNYVSESFIKKEETLLISDELNDAVGLNMAIIVDAILKKGYMPDGFEQMEDYRVYRYKKE